MPVATKFKPPKTQKKLKEELREQEQAVVQEQMILTQQQSLLVMQTLLGASLGCITFLRALLPDDNFEDNHIGAATVPSSSQGDAGKGLRIKTIKRGYSAEADKLLDYIEKGVMDALQKSYLRSVIFLIFLDPMEPENVVESYTLNFFYQDGSVEMAMEVSGLGSQATAALGTPVTVGDVKKAVKKLIRNLICITQNFKDLPQTRYIDIKLLYLPNTPQDYEPPCFKPCVDKLYYATHSSEEVPEKSSVGKLQTGHHGVAIKAASIIDYLPIVNSDDAQTFGAPRQSMGRKRRQSEEECLQDDAKKRTCIWDAEQLSLDRSDFDPTSEQSEPRVIGTKVNGVIEAPIDDIAGRHRERSHLMTPGGRQLVGFPKRLAVTPLSPTQDKEDTQIDAMDVDTELKSGGKVSGELGQQQVIGAAPQAPNLRIASQITVDASTNRQASLSSGDIETAALLERQREEARLAIDFEMDESCIGQDPMESISKVAQGLRISDRPMSVEQFDKGMRCACGDAHEDGKSYECEECGYWIHEECSGYINSTPLPSRFVCLSCRIKPKLSAMSAESKSKILERVKTFAQFRRLLAGFWAPAKDGQAVASAFEIKKKLACDQQNAHVQIANLLTLNYIGEPALKPKSGKKSKTKKAHSVRHVYYKNEQAWEDYRTYFHPRSVQEEDVMDEADRYVAEDKKSEHKMEAPPAKSIVAEPKASRALEHLDVTLVLE